MLVEQSAVTAPAAAALASTWLLIAMADDEDSRLVPYKSRMALLHLQLPRQVQLQIKIMGSTKRILC